VLKKIGMGIERFEDIEAWQLARDLTRKVYATKNDFQDVYDHAGRTRAAIRGFIKYLVAYEQDRRKKGSPNR